jgi:hypothetical protein
MAVHHFTAQDLDLSWKSMDTFPEDGSTVEIKDEDGNICKAKWHSGRILPSSFKLGKPIGWREVE